MVAQKKKSSQDRIFENPSEHRETRFLAKLMFGRLYSFLWLPISSNRTIALKFSEKVTFNVSRENR